MNKIYEEQLNRYIELTDKSLKEFLSKEGDSEAQSKLVEAMRYSLEAGGKRVRPVLVYAFCEALGGNFKDAVTAACAIEMIHTFSLIHDDLPAMDDDDYRRGKPSCHKAYGEAMAILAGDALSVLPFEMNADDANLSPEQKISIVSLLANAVGKDGMIGGQVMDMAYEKRTDITDEMLRAMYRNKTGQLIAVSCVMGGICADADRDKLRTAAEYGFRLGLAFQIIDDILDVTGTAAEMGKLTGSDEKDEKTTFVTIYGVEKAQEIADQITNEALEWLGDFENTGFLKELTELLLRRKK
ncbi:MAG: polyprenyl synthetase family protein [Ruminococcus sp.]|nr:polyprenyl synthetase family protein [Ruminococcus sp.]